MQPDLLLEMTQWDFFWVPSDARVVDRPELLYVSCPRQASFLNMVTRTRAPDTDLPRLVDEVVAAHAGRDSRWMVCTGSRTSALEAALTERGYAPGPDHHVCIRATSLPLPASRSGGFEVRRVEDLAALRAMNDVCDRAFGTPFERTEAELSENLRACASPGARVHRYVAWDSHSGAPLSAGGLTLFPGLRFGLLWAGATSPEARGRGAYSAVLAARIAHARAAGCAHVGLYAREDTSSPIVQRLGFQRHGDMAHWVRPG